MGNDARLYSCALCQVQVIICSDCDRGNIYCGSICSQFAREQSLRLANQRYQNTLRGKHQHADRQRRYQMKMKIMTYQTYHGSTHHDLLFSKPSECAMLPIKLATDRSHCHFCGKSCSQFVRTGFLHQHASWPRGP